MFLVTFKTEKNLFHLTDPKPVLSQKLVNVTSTKYILQLALNRFAKSPIGYTLISLISVEVGINVEGVQKLPNH